jgi:hypothetical protein
MSQALAVQESTSYPRYTEAENLARTIIARLDSVTAKLRTLEHDIRRLWAEFDKLKGGETILGCATKKEFCEKKLNRTPRTIQYLLAGQSNPADRPCSKGSEGSELSSPVPALKPPVEIPLEDALEKMITRTLKRPSTREDYELVQDICKQMQADPNADFDEDAWRKNRKPAAESCPVVETKAFMTIDFWDEEAEQLKDDLHKSLPNQKFQLAIDSAGFYQLTLYRLTKSMVGKIRASVAVALCPHPVIETPSVGTKPRPLTKQQTSQPNTVRDDLIKEIMVLSKPLKMNKADSKQFKEFLDEIQDDKTFLFGVDELKDIRKAFLDKTNLPIFAAWLAEHPQGSWCCFFNVIRPGTFTDDEVSAVSA